MIGRRVVFWLAGGLLFGCGDSPTLTEPPDTRVCADIPAATAPTPSSLWAQITPSGSAPAARSAHAVAYDHSNDRMIVFGGVGASGPMNDVWVLNSAFGVGGRTPSWQQLSESSVARPVPRSHALVGYDSISNRLIVFGGVDPQNRILTDLWVLTNANGMGGSSGWIQLTPATQPIARVRGAAVYHAATNRMTITGGVSCSSTGCTPSNAVEVLVNANGLGGTPAYSPRGNASFPGRYDHAVADDRGAGRIIVFGGQTWTGLDESAAGRVADTWVLQVSDVASTATRVSASTVPPARSSHTAIWDADRRRPVIFGGADLQNLTRGDVWILDQSASSWFQYAAGSRPAPAPRNAHTAVYGRDRMLVFAGHTGGGTRVNDLWSLRLNPPSPASVAIVAQGSTVCVNNSLQLVAVVRDAENNVIEASLEWRSANPAVATVDPTGRVTPVAPGSAVITVCVATLCSPAFTVTVQPAKEPTPPPVTPNPGVALSVLPGQGGRGCVDPTGAETNFSGFTLLARGGAPASGYTWTVASGSTLPPGLALEPLTGILRRSSANSLMIVGRYTFNVTVSDGARTATGTVTVDIEPANNPFGTGFSCPFIPFGQPGFAQNSPVPNLTAVAGRAYGASLFVTVGGKKGAATDADLPLAWELASGRLPAGMVVDQARGIIRGTPAAAGTYTFTVRVRDSRIEAPCPGGCPVYTLTVQ